MRRPSRSAPPTPSATCAQDLFGAIERGELPQWTPYVQVMPEREAEQTPSNPFDLTKVWPHGDYPLIEVGVMELDRNPDNYFAEIEQAAFSPSKRGAGHRLLARHNSFDGPAQAPEYAEPPLRISGDAERYDHREGNDDYGQPRALFRLFDDGQKQRLFANIAAAMRGVPTPIVERQLAHFRQVDPAYADGVAKALAA